MSDKHRPLEVFWFKDSVGYTALVRRGREDVGATCGRDRRVLGRMVPEVVELVLETRAQLTWRYLRPGDRRLRAMLA